MSLNPCALPTGRLQATETHPAGSGVLLTAVYTPASPQSPRDRLRHTPLPCASDLDRMRAPTAWRLLETLVANSLELKAMRTCFPCPSCSQSFKLQPPCFCPRLFWAVTPWAAGLQFGSDGQGHPDLAAMPSRRRHVEMLHGAGAKPEPDSFQYRELNDQWSRMHTSKTRPPGNAWRFGLLARTIQVVLWEV